MLSTSCDIDHVGFKVERCEAELVVPSKPTPHEYKQLSDIDDQEGFRCHIHMIQLYQHNPSMDGTDPVEVIKKAIADTLVFYYPFAGRLREGPGKKLFVECTAEGILFIEANANVMLHQFHNSDLQPPFPSMDQLLFDVPTSSGVLNSPLLLIQVTRLKCGGFIFGFRFNHTMADAFGTLQFMKAVSEMARGALTPSTLPVWQRALFNATDPPRVTHVHHEYDQQLVHTNITPGLDHNMAHRSFFFGSTEISAIRKLTVPSNTSHCSSFVLLSAYMWRIRTKILNLNSEEEVRCLCAVNLRSKRNPGLPLGYYGNAITWSTAVTTAGKLCENPLSYAIELVRKAEDNVTEEYLKSEASFLVTNGRPKFSTIRSYIVVDLTGITSEEVDFGWGKPTYGGPAAAEPSVLTNISSYFISFQNQKTSQKGVLVSICLPLSAMDRFVLQFDALSNTN